MIKKHGQGIYTHADGNKYVGEFRDGNFNGQGTYILANSEILEGVWKNNKFQNMPKGSFSGKIKKISPRTFGKP